MDLLEISPYLLAATIAWLIAQLAKYLLDAVKSQRLTNVKLIYQSGSMPSVHSAIMAAVTTVIAIQDGINSGLFTLALAVTVVIMYDAMQVRRAVGEQGLILQELLRDSKNSRNAHYALGHKPLEVAVGALIGVTVAFFITYFFL